MANDGDRTGPAPGSTSSDPMSLTNDLPLPSSIIHHHECPNVRPDPSNRVERRMFASDEPDGDGSTGTGASNASTIFVSPTGGDISLRTQWTQEMIQIRAKLSRGKSLRSSRELKGVRQARRATKARGPMEAKASTKARPSIIVILSLRFITARTNQSLC
jgi:hypothetical protein